MIATSRDHWTSILKEVFSGQSTDEIEDAHASVCAYVEKILFNSPPGSGSRRHFEDALSLCVREWDPLREVDVRASTGLRIGIELLLEFRPLSGWPKVMEILENADALCVRRRERELLSTIALVPRYFGHLSFDDVEQACFIEGATALFRLARKKPAALVTERVRSWAVAALIAMGVFQESGSFRAASHYLGEIGDVAIQRDAVINGLQRIQSGYLAEMRKERFAKVHRAIALLGVDDLLKVNLSDPTVLKEITDSLALWQDPDPLRAPGSLTEPDSGDPTS